MSYLYISLIVGGILQILGLILNLMIYNNDKENVENEESIKKRYQHSTGTKLASINFVVGIVTVIFGYICGKEESKRQDHMYSLAKVSAHLDTLSANLDSQSVSLLSLDTALSNRNLEIGSKNYNLIDKTKAIANNLQSITNEIKHISNRSSEVLGILDKKTDDEFAISGELNLHLNTDTSSILPLIVDFGSNIDNNYNPPYNYLPISTFQFLTKGSTWDKLEIKVIKNIVYLNGRIEDIEGKIIMELEDNKWRVNKKFLGKFNFDKKGLEIIDDFGRIIFSIDLSNERTIKIRGIALINENSFCIVSDNGCLLSKTGNLKTKLNLNPTKKIFKYLGNKWHGVRMR